MRSGDGELDLGPEGRSVRFERHFDATAEEVWDALTNPELLGRWLLTDTASIEPRVGGAVSLDWGTDGKCSGTVAVFDPPRTLEYSWVEAAGTSIARFELRPDDSGVLLVLHHRELPASAHAGVGAGWNAHLDKLAAVLAGEEFDFWQRFHELEPEYAKRLVDLKS
jgi:uncharacterized protein YndB with AHSA1/START domain